MRRTPAATAAAACMACWLVGWLAGCAPSRPAEEGVRIGDETLRQFRAGVTTEAWLTAVLGPPSSWAAVAGVENTRVLRYATGESMTGLGALISGRSSRNTAVTYFIVTDGVVTRFWADRAVEPTLLGKRVEAPPGVKEAD